MVSRLKRLLTGGRPRGAPTQFPLGAIGAALYVFFICLPIFALLVKVVQQDNTLASLVSSHVLLALRLSLVTSAISRIR